MLVHVAATATAPPCLPYASAGVSAPRSRREHQLGLSQYNHSTHVQTLLHPWFNLNNRANQYHCGRDTGERPFRLLDRAGRRGMANRPRQHLKWLQQDSAKLSCESTNLERVGGYGICTFHQTHMEGTRHPRKLDPAYFKLDTKKGKKQKTNI